MSHSTAVTSTSVAAAKANISFRIIAVCRALLLACAVAEAASFADAAGYAQLAESCRDAVEHYAKDVMAQTFPSPDESFAFSTEEEEELKGILEAESNPDDSLKLAAKLGL